MQHKRFRIVQDCIARSRRNTGAHEPCQHDQPESVDDIYTIVQTMETIDPQEKRSHGLAMEHEEHRT